VVVLVQQRGRGQRAIVTGTQRACPLAGSPGFGMIPRECAIVYRFFCSRQSLWCHYPRDRPTTSCEVCQFATGRSNLTKSRRLMLVASRPSGQP